MACSNYDEEEQARFEAFVADLTRITRKHGIAVRVFGGIYMADEVEELKDTSYSTINDGDLWPTGPGWPD